MVTPKGIALLLGVNFFGGNIMNKKTKQLTTIGTLCALAYAATVFGRVPLILFLKYDPKDIIVTLGGFVFGPLDSLSMAVLVSLAEMLTVSENGILGFLMNVISSASFACTAAFLYRKKRMRLGAAAGLLCGWGCMIAIMLLWNYLIAPIYMGTSREAVARLLIPALLPFNLIKGGLNAGITMLLYRPVTAGLRHSHFIETDQEITR